MIWEDYRRYCAGEIEWTEWDESLRGFIEKSKDYGVRLLHRDAQAAIQLRCVHKQRLKEWHCSRGVQNAPISLLETKDEAGHNILGEWEKLGGQIINNKMTACVLDPIWLALSDFSLPVTPLRVWGYDFDTPLLKSDMITIDRPIDPRLNKSTLNERLRDSLKHLTKGERDELRKGLRSSSPNKHQEENKLFFKVKVKPTGELLPDSAWPVPESINLCFQLPWETK